MRAGRQPSLRRRHRHGLASVAATATAAASVATVTATPAVLLGPASVLTVATITDVLPQTRGFSPRSKRRGGFPFEVELGADADRVERVVGLVEASGPVHRYGETSDRLDGCLDVEVEGERGH